MEEIDAGEITGTGTIIVLTRRIESAMTALGATAPGLHDKTDMLASRLNPEAVKLLHYIAAVRNRAAHEDVGTEPTDMDCFVEACGVVLDELALLSGKAPTGAPLLPETGRRELPNTPEEMLRSEVHSLRLTCAFVPGLHIVFPLTGIVAAAFPAAEPLLAALFWLSAIPVMIEGWRTKIDTMLYGALALFTAVYLYGVLSALRRRRQPRRLPLWWALTPGLNLGYFLHAAAHKVDWRLLLTDLLLTAACLTGIWLFGWRRQYLWGFGLWAASYFLGLPAALWLHRKRRKK